MCRRLVLTRGRGQTRLTGSSRADEEHSSRLRLPAAANAAAAHAWARVLCGQAVGPLGEAPRSGTAGHVVTALLGFRAAAELSHNVAGRVV